MDNLDGRRISFKNIYEDISKNLELLVFKVQKDFCEEIEKFEGAKEFKINTWSTECGAGITQFLEEGDVFEKVAVCASKNYGMLPPSAFLLLSERNADLNPPEKSTFCAIGINGVAYPKNPHVPTLNFSYRYFEINDDEDKIWWFGGGTDLTPYILNVDDCRHFHKILKSCCDSYDKSSYRTFKKYCDEYFYLEHRGERRGIGGIFFNKLNFPNKEECFQFVSLCMHNIICSYIPIVSKSKEKKFSFDDREWQLLQRGRSVEFNFICDKGIELALLTPGVQYENVLIFLPPEVKWQYDYTPEKNSKKSELLEILRNPREWV